MRKELRSELGPNISCYCAMPMVDFRGYGYDKVLQWVEPIKINLRRERRL